MGIQTFPKEIQMATGINGTHIADKNSKEQDQVSMTTRQLEENARKRVLSNWKYIIENIDPLPLLEELDKEKIVEKENFVDIIRKKRSHQASLVLIAACKKINNENDFLKFQNIVRSISVPCAERLNKTTQHDQLSVDPKTMDNVATALKQRRTEFEDKLQSSDFLEIVNDFVEASVFDLNQLETLVCSYPNREAATHLVDVILFNENNGSIVCLTRSLTECKRSRKFRSFLTNNDSPLNRENQDRRQVKLEEGMLHLNTATDRNEGRLTINVGDIAVQQQLHLNQESLAVEFCKSLNVCVTETQKGSIVLVLKYLDNKIIEQIKTNIKHGRITQCLDAILNDKSMQDKLSPGKMTIEVTLQLSSNSYLPSGSQHKLDSVNIITLNREFLIEEVDTISLPKAFKRRGYMINIESFPDRRSTAEKIVEFLASEDISNVLEILKEENMLFVLDRLQKCKKAYASYTPSLHQRIVGHLQYIATKLDYEVIREIFVERHVFKSDLFNSLDDMFKDEKDKIIAILIKVVKSDSFAVSTLIDVMLMCSLDSLVTNIIQDTVDIKSSIQENETDSNLKVTQNSSGESTLLFKGIYAVDIHKGKGVTYKQLQKRIRHNWGSLRNNMEPSYLCQKLLDANFVSGEDFIRLGDYSMSIQTHKILITIHRNLKNDTDAKVFMDVIQDPTLKQLADILASPAGKKPGFKTNQLQRQKDILEIHRSILQNDLSQRDIVIVIDKFIESSVFDIDTIESVINQPKDRTSETFVNKVISHTERGACECLYNSLSDEKFSQRYLHFITAMNFSDNIRFTNSSKTSVISANRIFLIEEVEPVTIISEFKKKGCNKFDELSRNKNLSRTELAKQFVSILEKETVLEQPFLQILESKHMHFILNRLRRYRDVSERYKDISTLRRLIANNILQLAECLDIDDIKQRYIERNIENTKLFGEIETTYKGRKDQLIAVIIATLNSDDNEVLTLLGILNGVPGSLEFFSTITDISREQSTRRYDVSGLSLNTNGDSAIGSMNSSPENRLTSLSGNVGKTHKSSRVSRQLSATTNERTVLKTNEHFTSEKNDSTMSSQKGSIVMQTKLKDRHAPRSHKFDVRESSQIESVHMKVKVEDFSDLKRKEYITSEKKESRMKSQKASNHTQTKAKDLSDLTALKINEHITSEKPDNGLSSQKGQIYMKTKVKDRNALQTRENITSEKNDNRLLPQKGSIHMKTNVKDSPALRSDKINSGISQMESVHRKAKVEDSPKLQKRENITSEKNDSFMRSQMTSVNPQTKVKERTLLKKNEHNTSEKTSNRLSSQKESVQIQTKVKDRTGLKKNEHITLEKTAGHLSSQKESIQMQTKVKARLLLKKYEHITSEKPDNRLSSQKESVQIQTKVKDRTGLKKNEHITLEKTASYLSFQKEPIQMQTKVKDRLVPKKSEHITTKKNDSRLSSENDSVHMQIKLKDRSALKKNEDITSAKIDNSLLSQKKSINKQTKVKDRQALKKNEGIISEKTYMFTRTSSQKGSVPEQTRVIDRQALKKNEGIISEKTYMFTRTSSQKGSVPEQTRVIDRQALKKNEGIISEKTYMFTRPSSQKGSVPEKTRVIDRTDLKKQEHIMSEKNYTRLQPQEESIQVQTKVNDRSAKKGKDHITPDKTASLMSYRRKSVHMQTEVKYRPSATRKECFTSDKTNNRMSSMTDLMHMQEGVKDLHYLQRKEHIKSDKANSHMLSRRVSIYFQTDDKDRPSEHFILDKTNNRMSSQMALMHIQKGVKVRPVLKEHITKDKTNKRMSSQMDLNRMQTEVKEEQKRGRLFLSHHSVKHTQKTANTTNSSN